MINRNIKKIIILSVVFVFCFLVYSPVWAADVGCEASPPSIPGGEWCNSEDCTKGKDILSDDSVGNRKIRVQVAIPGLVDDVCYVKSYQLDDNGDLIPVAVAQYYVKDLPTFIQKVYSFSVGVIAIVAVLMIMIGGLQWIFAAGNIGKVSNARSLITSALAGLILALSSYVILYTLNPRLTNIQITGLHSIKTLNLKKNFCRDLETGTLIARSTEGSATEEVTKGEENEKIKCNVRFYVQDSAQLNDGESLEMCVGTYCGNGKQCLQVALNSFDCLSGAWIGQINNGGGILTQKKYVEEVSLVALCVDGLTNNNNQAIVRFFDKDQTQTRNQDNFSYEVSGFDYKNQHVCAGQTDENVKGYILKVKVDNKEYYLDKNCKVIYQNGKTDPYELDHKLITNYNKVDSNMPFSCDILVDTSFKR